jgi:hypothetical protein
MRIGGWTLLTGALLASSCSSNFSTPLVVDVDAIAADPLFDPILGDAQADEVFIRIGGTGFSISRTWDGASTEDYRQVIERALEGDASMYEAICSPRRTIVQGVYRSEGYFLSVTLSHDPEAGSVRIDLSGLNDEPLAAADLSVDEVAQPAPFVSEECPPDFTELVGIEPSL